MADTVLDRAIRRREALATELRKLDQFIMTYRTLSSEPATSASNRVVIPPNPTMRIDLLTKLPQMSQEKAALAMLDYYGPMSAKEMVARLDALGVKIGGKDPVLNLSSVLSHSKRAKYDSSMKAWAKASASETEGQRG